ncbi:MAG: type VI secretion system ImpA family N-terminal domain-containing protein [Marivita sp.]|uniref:type VI secretion system protein TssA n=1 Tax=Marivita sp. TaxID=2003365 RepID=UPI003EF81D4A
MTLDWITAQISDDAPAGPDLWEDDDPTFSDYYFDAVARLPEADDYVKLGIETSNGNKTPDQIFDPSDVKLSAELKTIDGLLSRTRDVRLLTLRAQWSMLAGNLGAVVDSVGGLASLLETMPNEAHPVVDGSARDRADALNDLAQMGAMILPLRYLDLASSGTSLRKLRVARGDFRPHDGEDDLTVDALLGALSAEGEATALVHEQLHAFKDALSRIANACLAHDTPHTVQIDPLTTEIDAVLKILSEAQPKLKSLSDAEDAAPVGADAVVSNSGGGTTVYTKPVTEVLDHDDARLRLIGVETYFGKNEPSSAAVLMVTQARILIGRNLVDAFESLMPNTAPDAKVSFLSDFGFQMSFGKLRELADQVQIDEYPEAEAASEPDWPQAEPDPEPEVAETPQDETVPEEIVDDPAMSDDVTEDQGTPDDEDVAQEVPVQEAPPELSPAPPPPTAPQSVPDRPAFYRVQTPTEAAAQIQAVETFFRAVERSSPIPVLLNRARLYMGQDFEALLKEIIPVQD